MVKFACLPFLSLQTLIPSLPASFPFATMQAAMKMNPLAGAAAAFKANPAFGLRTRTDVMAEAGSALANRVNPAAALSHVTGVYHG